MDRFEFLSILASIYDKNSLNLTEYQNEIQEIKDQKKILKLRQSELPISVDFENQLSKSDNFATSNPNEIVNSRIKAEYICRYGMKDCAKKSLRKICRY